MVCGVHVIQQVAHRKPPQLMCTNLLIKRNILKHYNYLTNSFLFKTISPIYIGHIKTLSIAICCLFNDLHLYRV